MTQGPLAASVPLYRPFNCKSNDWVRFLKANEELSTGQMILSADHKSKATLQDDGNFVVYTHDTEGKEVVAFATGTERGSGGSGASRLIMQLDHDLVLLSDTGQVIWRTNTANKGLGALGTAHVALDDEGVLHVIDAAGASIWSSAGSLSSQLRSTLADAANVAAQVGSLLAGKAAAAAGAAAETGKGVATAAIGAGKTAVGKAVAAAKGAVGGGGGSGGGGGGEAA